MLRIFCFYFLHYPGKVQELDIASIMDGRVSWFCRVEGLVQGLVEKDLHVVAWKMRDENESFTLEKLIQRKSGFLKPSQR